MQKVTIRNTSETNETLEATFSPDQGMNLMSYKKGDIEVIDQSTLCFFEERSAGLGALIGPHFYHRKEELIPRDFDESLFPFIAKLKEKGTKEPFSHGIARYAPWKFKCSETQIKATLLGKDTWNGIELRKLEGMDFAMLYEATMMPYGLYIRYGITSEKPSVIGLHYYYYLPQKKGRVYADVQKSYNDQGTWKEVPKKWLNSYEKLFFDLSQNADYGFGPHLKEEDESRIILDAVDHEVHLFYDCLTEDNSWQLWRLPDSSFVCIEPLSAKDPKKPSQNHSLLEVKIEIF